MIYSFITEQDLDIGMKQYFREQITELEEKMHIQITSEGAAFSLIKAKINNRYDLALLLPPVTEYIADADYLKDSFVCKDNLIYKALQDSTGEEPDEDGSVYWKINDPRDKLLVVYCAILTIYFMMRSACPRKISDQLENDYAMVLEWLDDVKAGNENPDWPLLPEGSSIIRWGSNEKLDHYL